MYGSRVTIDPVARFLRGRTMRRALALAAFGVLLYEFRHLAPMLVFFVAFQRVLGAGARLLAEHARVQRRLGVLGLVALLLGAVAAAVAVGVGRGIHAVVALRESLPGRLALVRDTWLYQRVREHLQETDRYLDSAKDYALAAAHYLTGFGHLLLHATIALILAVIFLLEEDELRGWARGIDAGSFVGTLVRWAGHVTDAVSLTLQIQVVVAACNAALTLPVLLALGLPHAGALALFIFACSLVPVVGNIVSGVVLSLLAWHARGWLGVGVFVALTAVLHKIESYYLNPRLTRRHVRLPAFVLILSLIAWEHLIGVAGLFVSFPFLFVANRIRREWAEEEAASAVELG